MSNISNKLDANQTIRQAFDPATGTLRMSSVGGSIAPVVHDKVVTTYVPSGNGLGEIATVTYSLAGVTVATLTMTYDANNKLSSVTRT